MFITNFTASVIRACIMGIISILANLFYRKNDSITSLSLSLLIALIINPFSIYDTGFKLSYLATAGIILFYNNIAKIFTKILNNKIAKMMSVCVCAQLMIIPINAYLFNNISLTFFISNFLATPIVGCIIILGFITIFVSFISFKLAKMLAIVLNLFLKVLNLIAKIVSNIPFGNILIVTPYINSIFLIYFLLIALNYFYNIFNSKNSLRKFYIKCFKKIKLKNLFLIIFTIIIFFNFIVPNFIPQNLSIYFIDVGQGDSTLIVTPSNKKILIDGGDGKNDVLISYLLDRRIKNIDYIIISHFDNDHVGGLFTIMEELKVRNVIISKQKENSENFQKFSKIVNNKKINVLMVNTGDKLKIEKDLYFDFLWPDDETNIMENILNNNSIVCKFCYKEFSMLFTGDIEKEAEEQILDKHLNKLNSTILKVAHHGSNTSSTEKFIEAVKPKIALIGVGENNNFGHPNTDVLNRLENIRSKNI